MTEPSRAIFLSYASEDAEAAQRICEVLRAAGIEVWFDQSELRGGDVWDRRIRQQIHECRLFIALISAHTEARDEGYFRREWKLAVDRTHDLAEDRVFLVPIAIDGISERTARVPDSFRHVQWTRLPGGQASAAFVERVRGLMSPTPPATTLLAPSPGVPGIPQQRLGMGSSQRAVRAGAAVAVAGVVAYLAYEHRWTAPHALPTPTPPAPVSVALAAFSPPPHSIAVLPFVNMSGNRDQEYFSDGITEELITALSQVSSLRVIARTSSFAFKGRNVDVGTIARALNVGSILEGSVRRAGSKIRVTVQLVNGRDGFHTWSQDYDRELKNILVMQSDIATAVAEQMKAKLFGDEASKIKAGGTRNPEAYDAFLRATEIRFQTGELHHAIELAERAVQLDPQFARGWLSLSWFYGVKSQIAASSSTWQTRARTAAETALRLAPELPRAHGIMSWIDSLNLDWDAATREVTAAEALDPTDVNTLEAEAVLNTQLGRWQDAIVTTRAVIERDPLGFEHRMRLAFCLSATGRHREAEQVYRDVVTRWPLNAQAHASIALEMLLDHRPAESLVEVRRERDERSRDSVLPMIYYALGRQVDSDRILAAYERGHGSDNAFDIAVIHAYRGETDLAFQWLDHALDRHDASLSWIKGNLAPFANITSDQRYPQLLNKIGLPIP